MELALLPLIDDAKCFTMVRKLRWPEGVSCPRCESMRVTRRGLDETQPDRQRYVCGDCGRNLDDLTDTIFAGHHQPLRVWLLCLYFLGLNLSNRQIARELGVDEDSAHDMATQLRTGIVARQPEVVLSGRSKATKSTWLQAIKGLPRRSKKRETRPPTAFERGSRSQHTGQGKAADLRDDSTHGRGRAADARQRPTGHDRPDPESHDQPRYDGLYRRVRYLSPTDGLGRQTSHGQPRTQGVRSR